MVIFKKVYYKIMHFCNKMSYYFSRLHPIDDKLIVLESEGDVSDNAEALFNYMKENNFLNTYRVVWLVDNPKKFTNTPNTTYISKKSGAIWFKAMYYLAIAKFFFYDHNNLLEYENLMKRKDQTIVYLTHGTAFKDSKNENIDAAMYFDKLISLGKLSTDIMCHFWHCDSQKVVELGEPRQDYYLSDLSSTKFKLDSLYSISQYKKVILWMPTFRKSYNQRLSENYFKTQTGLPIINTRDDLNMLDTFLEEINTCILLKIHHLQADLPIFTENFNNIYIVKDSDLKKKNIKLYKFIALTDALITDYSSISVDYLPLNRPVIYTLDDYEEYKNSRGIYPKNAVEYMPGEHVINIKQLKKALIDIANNQDSYREERKRVTDLFYTFQPGKASERVLEYFDVKKK